MGWVCPSRGNCNAVEADGAAEFGSEFVVQAKRFDRAG